MDESTKPLFYITPVEVYNLLYAGKVLHLAVGGTVRYDKESQKYTYRCGELSQTFSALTDLAIAILFAKSRYKV